MKAYKVTIRRQYGNEEIRTIEEKYFGKLTDAISKAEQNGRTGNLHGGYISPQVTTTMIQALDPTFPTIEQTFASILEIEIN